MAWKGWMSGCPAQCAGTAGTRPCATSISASCAGSEWALIGTRGSGQTTLRRTVRVLHRHGAGRIPVGGRDTGSVTEWAWRRRAGAWIPQKPATGRLPLLAGELPAGGGARAEAAEAADKLGVGHLADRPLHTLSGGRLQRMYLARAGGCAAAGAGVLLADEPTAALDFSGREEAAGVLLSLPVTVVVVAEELVPRSLCARMAGARALRCCWRCARGPVRPRGSGYQRRAACGRAR